MTKISASSCNHFSGPAEYRTREIDDDYIRARVLEAELSWLVNQRKDNS